MKRYSFIMSGLSILSAFLMMNAPARAQEPQKDIVLFMRQKLALSQNVIEGITLQHYDLVITNADKLMNMSQSNVWVSVKSKGYQAKTAEFQKNVRDLIAASRAKDTTNMLASWARTTESCTSCHEIFRTEQYIRGHLQKKAP